MLAVLAVNGGSSIPKFFPHNTIKKSRFQMHTAQGQDAKCF